MNKKRSGFKLGVAAIAAVGALVFLHVAQLYWPVGADRFNAVVNTAMAWVAVYSLWLTAGGLEGGASRRPWRFFAAGFAVLALGETLTTYNRVIVDFAFRGLWFANFLNVAGFLLIIAALAIRARAFGRPTFSLLYIFILTLVTAAMTAAVTPVFRAAIASPGIPVPIVFLIVLMPLFDLAIIALAFYVATTFAGGVGGRPWVSVALGVSFSAVADFLDMYGAWLKAEAGPLRSASLVVTFLGFAAVAWGAWHRRKVVPEALT